MTRKLLQGNYCKGSSETKRVSDNEGYRSAEERTTGSKCGDHMPPSRHAHTTVDVVTDVQKHKLVSRLGPSTMRAR